MDKQQLLEYLKGEMIVSCQALPGEALYKEEGGVMCLMAQAVKNAGVKAIRAQGVLDIKQIKEKYPSILLMADISTLEEAIEAEKAGVDFVGTTMNGYTPYTEDSKQFNPGLVKEIVENVKVPVIAEGKIHTLQQAKQAFEAGAHCIVVGGAITRPQEIATRFLSELR